MHKFLQCRILFALFALLTTSSLVCSAQKQANNWYFSTYGLDFNVDPPRLIFDAAPHESRVMGIMSDSLGRLQFYTDGFNIWNRLHQRMPNGREIFDLHYYSSFQESLIVPKPGSKTIFYIFMTDPASGQANAGFYYTIVDMSLDGGKGDVLQPPTKLTDDSSYRMGAVFHKNQRDIWIMVYQDITNTYLGYLLTKDGVQLPVLSTNAAGNTSWGGQFKFSPDGSMAVSSYSDYEEGFDLIDFNNATGRLSNIRHFDVSYYVPCASFSSDGTKLYISRYNGGSNVLQYDVSLKTKEAIESSATDVYSIIYNSFYWFQLAPDGKIYITKGGGGGGSGHLGVINYPNLKGKECQVVENQLYLEGHESFVNWAPLFIENYFFRTDLDIQNFCLQDVTKFKLTNYSFADSVEWTVGDGHKFIDDSISYSYATEGIYNIEAKIFYGKRTEVIKKTITINPLPVFSLGNDTTVCQGYLLKPDVNSGSYLWNTSSTLPYLKAEQSGTFILHQTNQFKCVYGDAVNLVVNPTPFVTLPNDTIICDNIILSLKSSTKTGTPLYQWNTGSTQESIDVTHGGLYWLRNNNQYQCMDTDSIFIVTKPSPKVNLGSDTILFHNSWLNIDAGNFGGDSRYLWDDFSQGRYRSIAGGWFPPGRKKIFVTVTASNGCKGYDEKYIEILNITDVENHTQLLKIYPVPSGEKLIIEMPQGLDYNVELYDLNSKKIYSSSFQGNMTSLNLQALPSGVYQLLISHAGTLITRRRIVKD